MRTAFLLAALSLGACASPAVEQAAQSCAYYSSIGPCFDGRDVTKRNNRDDLSAYARLKAASLADVTNRANRDDLSTRAQLKAASLADVTNRTNRDDLSNRTRPVATSVADITNRTNREDTTDRPLICP